MAHDLQWLKLFIYGRTTEVWAAGREPFTLSTLGAELKAKGVDYKPLTGSRTLSAWAKADGVHGLRYVGPPEHKMAGFVPGAEARPRAAPKPGRRIPGEARVLDTLRALSALTDAELDAVDIPVKVLVRMLDG